MKKLIAVLLSVLFVFALVSCSDISENPENDTTLSSENDTTLSSENDTTLSVEDSTADDSSWSEAIYTEDTVLGEGQSTIYLSVITPEKTVVFTVKTDKTVLGDALSEVKIIEGEEGPYGLYIKKVNGITADYDIDKHYWALSENGTDLMTGADGEKITGGEHYEIVRKK